MNLKNIFFVIFWTAILLSSCSDFLELQPESNGVAVNNTSSDSVFFKSPNELESALSGAYKDFQNEYFQLDYFVNGDAQSDDAYAGGDNPANFQIDDFMLDATNSNVSRDWRYLYSTIGKVNNIINNLDDIKESDLPPGRKNEILGEASFIRAFMYFQLVQLWGDVPLQLTTVKSISADKLDEIYAVIFPARAPADQIYDQIITDLGTAESYVKVSALHKGFATKGAVHALLAKVYATRTPVDWNKVNQYCDLVISGPYSLLTSYDFLWDNAHENSAESIFEINYNGGAQDGNWGINIFRGLDWKKFNLPANDLVAAFQKENDIIRYESSIIYGDVSGKWSDIHYPQTKYPFINKYRKVGDGSDQNYIFIRLADILLLKAEALNETGNASGALELLNRTRTRVNLPPVNISEKAALRSAILKERRLELAFEGIRWFDLKRTGTAIDVMNNAIDHTGNKIGYNLTENRLLWPIPQAEIDKNSKLTQNNGY